MMLTVHGFSPNTKYQHVKLLIRQECNIDDFILDNLVADNDGTKKVRVGLRDDNEGYKLMKFLDGFRMPDNYVLKVFPLGKAVGNANAPHHGSFEPRPGFQDQPRNNYPSRNDYMDSPNDHNKGPHGSSGLRGSHGPHGSGEPHGFGGHHGHGGDHRPPGPQAHSAPTKHYGGPHSQNPVENMRPSPWASNSNSSNQWGSNPPMAAQVPQNTFGYSSSPQQSAPSVYPPHGRPFDGRQGPPPEQNYSGYKPNVPPRQPNMRDNLRNIDTIENSEAAAPTLSGRYPPSQPYTQDKPVRSTYNSPDEVLNPSCTSAAEIADYATVERKNQQSLKRSLQDTSPSTQEPPKKLAKSGKKFQKGRFWDNQQSMRVSILDASGPISEEKFEEFKQSGSQAISEGNFRQGPCFLGISRRRGGIIVNCLDNESKQWLIKNYRSFGTWEGACLKLVDESDMPKLRIGVAWIPPTNLETADILKSLRCQNRDMSLNSWKVLHRKVEKEGQTLTFSFDESSLQDLINKGYRMFYGFRQIQIRVKPKKGDGGSGTEERAEGMTEGMSLKAVTSASAIPSSEPSTSKPTAMTPPMKGQDRFKICEAQPRGLAAVFSNFLLKQQGLGSGTDTLGPDTPPACSGNNSGRGSNSVGKAHRGRGARGAPDKRRPSSRQSPQ